MKQIKFTIYNDTNSDAIFGVAYTLEVLQDSNWYVARMKGVKGDTQPTWPAIAQQLPARGTAINTIDLSNYEGIEPGRYRLIKEVSLLMGNQKPYVLVAQFTISETNQSESASTIVTSQNKPTPPQTTTAVPTTKSTTTLTPTRKPAIYLYPEKPTEVHVTLEYQGQLTCTYPAYNQGWMVTAYPNGTLINHTDKREYSYLYWEGLTHVQYDFSKGFVVVGKDTAAFLQQKLAYLGLTPREYNEFIVYWLPQMQDNPYNLITFQGRTYTDSARLTIEPQPDSLLRVFMAYRPLQEKVDIEPPILSRFERNGFTIVEWGGACVE